MLMLRSAGAKGKVKLKIIEGRVRIDQSRSGSKKQSLSERSSKERRWKLGYPSPTWALGFYSNGKNEEWLSEGSHCRIPLLSFSCSCRGTMCVPCLIGVSCRIPSFLGYVGSDHCSSRSSCSSRVCTLVLVQSLQRLEPSQKKSLLKSMK